MSVYYIVTVVVVEAEIISSIISKRCCLIFDAVATLYSLTDWMTISYKTLLKPEILSSFSPYHYKMFLSNSICVFGASALELKLGGFTRKNCRIVGMSRSTSLLYSG